MRDGPDQGGHVQEGHPVAAPGLLSQPDFRRAWLAGALAQTMRWLEVLVVSLFVLQLTGSAGMVAFVLFLRMLPSFLFGTLTGIVAERVSRRILLGVGLGLLSLLSLVLGTLVATGNIAMWHVALGVFLNGTFWSMDHPVRRTLMGEIAGPHAVARAMGLDSSTMNATRALGPAIGGTLLAAIGMEGAYFLGTVLFALAAWQIMSIERPIRPVGGSGNILADIREGLRFIRGSRVLMGTLCMTVAMNFWGLVYMGLVPVIGRQELGLGPFATGLLMAMEGTGAFFAALMIAWKVRSAQYLRLYFWGSCLCVASALAFSQSGSAAFSFGILIVAGLGFACFGAMQSTIVLSSTPPALRPRVMGVLAVCIGGGNPLGILHVGLLADWFGAPTAVSIVCAEGLLAMTLIAWRWPELIRPFKPWGDQ
ncbi:putative MFS family arabinose efflux permease [Constrictibacter sp. MBR-5]